LEHHPGEALLDVHQADYPADALLLLSSSPLHHRCAARCSEHIGRYRSIRSIRHARAQGFTLAHIPFNRYTVLVIVNFADDTTQDIYDGRETKAARRIPKKIWIAARRKLDILAVARDLPDLRAPPANRLEKRKGNLAGAWSIRSNDQYRVVFEFADGHAAKVRITDYH